MPVAINIFAKPIIYPGWYEFMFYSVDLKSFAMYAVSLSLLLSMVGCGGERMSVKPRVALDDYGALERSVFHETNVLRRDPRAYADVLKGMAARMRGNIYHPENETVAIVTREGKSAVMEAIAVLEGQSPLTTLTWSDELAALARAHVEDTGAKGLTGHDSSGGSSFPERVAALADKERFSFTAENIAYGLNRGREVVAQLFVDDGVPSRGHRDNLLTEKLKYSGVGCGYHREFQHMCVAIYADGL